ncbi:SDR family oxidoreductase [Piscinibacter sakaiensis]|uniref:SDR family oxidoreductase n=1 Tax=Piscinibacter sakaiensis TaxID=1547922 RepID=UPI003AAF88B9
MSVRQLLNLEGRTALITGASGGLGLEMARALGEMGARIAILDRDAEQMQVACASLDREGVAATGVHCDIRMAATIAGAVADVAGGHPIDILINNAGAAWTAPTVEHSLEGWQKLVDVNLTGTFLVTQEVGRRFMIPQRYGKIINISSFAGLKHNPNNTGIAYGTTKGALVAFTRSLAGEWGPYNITVNCLAPGFIPTRMSRYTLETWGEDHLREQVPLRRVASPEDLGGIAVLLASEASRHITGQTIAVDGGITVC